MPLTVDSLRHGIGAIRRDLEVDFQTLNELDGQIGDGDLGITLVKAFRELERISGDLPDDLGLAFAAAASAVTRVSSSSFGTLLATGLMAAAKATRGRASASWDEVPALIRASIQSISARGKAQLGDKTVMDALEAAAAAAAGASTPAAMAEQACKGVDQALDSFRTVQSKVGRARIFGEKTVGMDDPGMVALRVMVRSLSDSQAK
jgi:dihydroxyacetone kinase-like protein